MKSILLMTFVFSFCCLSICLGDEFSDVTCSSNIPKAVVGKKMETGLVLDAEAVHKNIALKHLGSDGQSEDAYFTIAWEICGREYIFLKDQSKLNDVINDVLPIPASLRSSYRFLPGSDCNQKSKRIDDIYAFAEQGTRGKKTKVKAAWEISRTTMKFRELPANEIECHIAH